MSERADLIPGVIAAAVAAAGPRGSNHGQWAAKVNEAIPFVVAMMGDGSRQWRLAEQMLDAQVFTAVYRGYEYEESSTRCVVTLETRESKRYPDGLEPIRTHRTDSGLGKSMRARLDSLEPGTNIVVWKAMEQGKDEDMKVRILAHFEARPTFKDPTPGRQPAEDASPASRDTGRSETHAERSAAGSADPVADRFNALPSKVKARVAKRLRDEEISFPHPGLDHADRMIRIIIEEEGS